MLKTNLVLLFFIKDLIGPKKIVNDQKKGHLHNPMPLPPINDLNLWKLGN